MVTAADVLEIFPGATVVAEGKPVFCRHCREHCLKSRIPVPEWRADGKIVERLWPDGRKDWGCLYCGRVAKLPKVKRELSAVGTPVTITQKPHPARAPLASASPAPSPSPSPLTAPSPAPSPDTLERVMHEFFGPLFEKTEGNIEIRCLPSGAQTFSRDHGNIIQFIRSHIDENIFFGVATRSGADGTKKGVAEISALWADLDYKTYAGGETEAFSILEQFKPKPSMMVKSGHGLHAYWIFERPVRADTGVERYLKAIAKALRSDPSVTDISRIMRVPGTFNCKNGDKILVRFRPDNGMRINWTQS